MRSRLKIMTKPPLAASVTDCGAFHHRHNGRKDGRSRQPGPLLRGNGKGAKRIISRMNPVQSSAVPKSETPGTTAVPRDYNFAADILKRNLDAGRADKIAFIDHRGKYSYADLADRVERFGHVLRGLGVRSEERVLICLLDTIDWPTAFLGCLKAGVVAVPVNTLMTEDDYRFMLADSRARLLVVSDALYPRFQKLIGESVDLDHVIVSGEDVKGHKRFEDLIDGSMAEIQTAPTVRDDIA